MSPQATHVKNELLYMRKHAASRSTTVDDISIMTGVPVASVRRCLSELRKLGHNIVRKGLMVSLAAA